jgi:hypothetical protein
MKLELNWKILLAGLAIIGVITTSLGYIIGVSSTTMTTGIKVWSVQKSNSVSLTSSTSYANVPGMKLTIDAPVGTNLVITFSTYCTVNPTTFLTIRLIVDGSAVAPKDTPFTYDGDAGTRSFTWVKHVSKGTHTIKIKYIVTAPIGGGMAERSLVVVANSYKEFT